MIFYEGVYVIFLNMPGSFWVAGQTEMFRTWKESLRENVV